MKLGVVVVTHGQLATALVNSAEMIVGDLPQFAAVSIGWHDDVDRAREEIGLAIARVGAFAGGSEAEPADVLVLTDLFGGTPANLGVTFVGPHVEVITGVNLPMLIKLARPQTSRNLPELARDMRDHGRSAIWVASELLRGDKARGEKPRADASAGGAETSEAEAPGGDSSRNSGTNTSTDPGGGPGRQP
jgi:PTS system mannose-specific IIA component